ncbi:MAG TPA: hypothetical protein VF857_05195 [Spirochaetota bacterium]
MRRLSYIFGIMLISVTVFSADPNQKDSPLSVPAADSKGSKAKVDPYPLLDADTVNIVFISTSKIGMDFGYDSSVELYGFFNTSVDSPMGKPAEKKSDSSDFDQYMNTINPDVVWNIYLQMSGNIAGAQYIERYNTRKKIWKYVNYMKKTIIPGNLAYLRQLESYIKKNPALASRLQTNSVQIVDCRKRAILSQKRRLTIIDDYQ